ncbi:MAG TPA: thiamine phosphate synthase [Henriciella marina]|uniref:thiamine phosphate synthase n=1 Tax=Henriciella sp. TaxID=1968823 RepID=UPI001851F951|nr:thiamine phosphate synthase [Henriciella sp.]HIG22268.1 thiamine phosphate synthase [Henriciella sp.]HIK64711.1 thiamine phosphate synthase [Henriciella marina]
MKHAAAVSRKFRNAASLAQAHTGPLLPGGFFLTDPARVMDARAVIAHLPDGIGVIIRHFGQADAMEDAFDVVSDCQRAGRIVLIGADLDLALATGADGVHWPYRMRKDLQRQSQSFGLLHTMSIHSPAELRAARAFPVDALIYSTVFPSGSPSAGQPIGLSRFAAAACSSSVPLYALGGITAANVEKAARFGGFASVSAFEALL